MHWYDFLWLIREIYTKRKPDLAKIERLGLLAIKIGQVHALRVDFLSPETCRHLATLYRRVSSLPPEGVEPLLVEAYGPNWESKFGTFDRTPFASASIGQVHRATLPDGTPVAVKLVKRQFTEQFRRDVQSAIRVFRFAIAFYPKLRGVANPVSLLQGIEKTTLAELDLRNEIAGHERLAQLTDSYRQQFDLRDLQFFRVYPELSNERVMVSEFLTGPTLDELMDRGELTYDNLLEFFRLQGFFLFTVGTFHGDIHPGNIFLRDGVFTFVDTGYIGGVTDRIRLNLFKFFDALSQDDFATSAEFLNTMADTPIDGERFVAFKKKFIALYDGFAGKSVGEESLTKKMMQTIRLGVLSGMNFEPGIFDIIKALMYMDGMVLRVNPKAVLLRDMRRYIDLFRPFV